MKIEIEIDSVKLVREALCVAEYAINQSKVKWHPVVKRRIGKLIKELDKHRPLGPDGKHGNLHTETCGCSDKG